MTRGGGSCSRPSRRRPRRSRLTGDSAVPGGEGPGLGGLAGRGDGSPRAGKLLSPKSFLPRRAGCFPVPRFPKSRPKGTELVLSAKDWIPAVSGRGRGCRSRGDPKTTDSLLTKIPPPSPNCAGLAPAERVSGDSRGLTPPHPGPL